MFNDFMIGFEKTFITGDGYKSLLSGLGITVLITVIAGVLGSLLGLLVLFIRRRNIKILNGVIAVYSDIITGVPVVVILMLLYYALLGRVYLPAVLVAIIGFTVIFSARCYKLMWNGTKKVDKGQREAAIAFGYSERKAFFKVVFPQAAVIFYPAYKAQIISLLKETSVVGFITVVDLTKAADQVRSQGTAALVPIIIAAVIYYLLTKGMKMLLGLADKAFKKKKKKALVKGVD